MEQRKRQRLGAPRALAAGGSNVAGLLTTMNEEADRVAMHGVRRSIVEAQAEAAGLPLTLDPAPASVQQ